MSFVTPEFAVFFAIVAVLFFVVPVRFRWLLILAASYLFSLSWGIQSAAILLLSTAINFLIGRLIGAGSTPRRQTAYLTFGILANLLLLGLFKYFNFLDDSVGAIFTTLHVAYNVPHLNTLLPVGVSFYTFMEIAYLVDVYRRRVEPETRFANFAQFVAFFPQLISGPIGRAPQLLPQLRSSHTICWDEARVAQGLRRIC